MEGLKKCCRCKLDKPIVDFQKRKDAKDGLKYWCKECDSLSMKKHYKANTDKVLTACKKRYKESEGRYLQQQKDYQKNNPEQRRKTLRTYVSNRRKRDINFKIKGTLQSRMNIVLRYKGVRKASKTMDLVGCSIDECRRYIEALFKEGMSWDNHGEWHIDHIKPISSFDLTKEEEQKQCFHYSNLQPLWKGDNLKKSNKITF